MVSVLIKILTAPTFQRCNSKCRGMYHKKLKLRESTPYPLYKTQYQKTGIQRMCENDRFSLSGSHIFWVTCSNLRTVCMQFHEKYSTTASSLVNMKHIVSTSSATLQNMVQFKQCVKSLRHKFSKYNSNCMLCVIDESIINIINFNNFLNFLD